MESLRLTIKGILSFFFAIISFFIALPFILVAFPVFQWFEDGYFSFNEMKEVIISIYVDIFDMLTFKEIRDYIKN